MASDSRMSRLDSSHTTDPLKDLPAFKKRRSEAPESPEPEWGGGSTQAAPSRRERGQWAPPRNRQFGRMQAVAVEPTGIRSNSSWTANRRRSQKNARLDAFNAPRLELPPRNLSTVEAASRASSSNESAQPERLSPPAEIIWSLRGPDTDQGMSTMPIRGPSQEITESNLGGIEETLRSPALDGSSIGSPLHAHKLPADHPLRVHLAELQKERQKRKYEWAGIIDRLGDEFRNPASYDRQLWLREEQMADEAIVETMLQIRLAEKGLPAGTESEFSSMSPERGRSRDEGRRRDYRSRAAAAGRHHHGGAPRGGRVTRYTSGRGRQQQRQHTTGHGAGRGGAATTTTIPLHQQDFQGNLHENFQTRKANAPSKKPMRWDDARKDAAVRTWLSEMGMPEGSPSSSATVVMTQDAPGSEAALMKQSLTLDRLPGPKASEDKNNDDDDDGDGVRSIGFIGFDRVDDGHDGHDAVVNDAALDDDLRTQVPLVRSAVVITAGQTMPLSSGNEPRMTDDTTGNAHLPDQVLLARRALEAVLEAAVGSEGRKGDLMDVTATGAGAGGIATMTTTIKDEEIDDEQDHLQLSHIPALLPAPAPALPPPPPPPPPPPAAAATSHPPTDPDTTTVIKSEPEEHEYIISIPADRAEEEQEEEMDCDDDEDDDEDADDADEEDNNNNEEDDYGEGFTHVDEYASCSSSPVVAAAAAAAVAAAAGQEEDDDEGERERIEELDISL